MFKKYPAYPMKCNQSQDKDTNFLKCFAHEMKLQFLSTLLYIVQKETHFYLRVVWNVRIHHVCSCKIEKSHPRGRNSNQERGSAESLVEIPNPRMRFSYPTWNCLLWLFFSLFFWLFWQNIHCINPKRSTILRIGFTQNLTAPLC